MKKHHPCSSCARCPFEHHYELYLKDILLALDSIERRVQKMDRDAFLHDRTTSSAVLRKFELIEKALEHIPPEFQAKHPELSWPRLASLRDRLVNPSSTVDYQAVWDVIKREIPDLKPRLEEIVVNL